MNKFKLWFCCWICAWEGKMVRAERNGKKGVQVLEFGQRRK